MTVEVVTVLMPLFALYSVLFGYSVTCVLCGRVACVWIDRVLGGDFGKTEATPATVMMWPLGLGMAGWWV